MNSKQWTQNITREKKLWKKVFPLAFWQDTRRAIEYNLQQQNQLVSSYKIQLHQEMSFQVPLEDASIDSEQTKCKF